ncbi:hypothetical protein BC629DRAFT_921442 [Irpex lacteus]|nr:hypothetical protein BC629DRAFT_921442 [Irpex lacteus]
MTLHLVPQNTPKAQPNFQPRPSIFFTSSTGSFAPINVSMACLGQVADLDRRDEHCIVSENRRISIRICWPGLPEWKFINLAVYDHTADPKPYRYREFAQRLALIIQKFHKEMVSDDAAVSAVPGWDLRAFAFERLYVSELRHISTGSWQPILHYR